MEELKEVEQNLKRKKNRGRWRLVKNLAMLLVIVLVLIFIITREARLDENALLRSNHVVISEGIFRMYVFQSGVELRNQIFGDDDEEYRVQRREFWETPIDGEMPVDIVKERALEKVQVHAYYVERVRRHNMEMRGHDLQFFTSLMEVDLRESGLDTEEMLGVNRDDFIAFRIYLETFDRLRMAETGGSENANEAFVNRMQGIIRANPDRFRVEILNEELYNEIGLPEIFVFE